MIFNNSSLFILIKKKLHVPFYVNLDMKRHNFEIIWHKLLGTLWKHKKEKKKGRGVEKNILLNQKASQRHYNCTF
jgi:hypothetical protein